MPQNTPRDEKWLLRRLAELEKRIAALETSPRAGNTSISSGKLTVGDPTGDNQIELDATQGDISFTQLGMPAGRLRSIDGVGGGAELEGSATPGDVLAFGTDARVGVSGIDTVMQANAQDVHNPGTNTSVGQISISFVYDGSNNHAPQIGLNATSQSSPDNAQVFISASGGVVFAGQRTSDAPWGGSGVCVLYVKSNRLYYVDGTGTTRGPL